MSDNAFERHGIFHLSASSGNTWLDDPSAWLHRYLGKVRDPSGAAAHRGTAVDHGMSLLWRDGDIESAIKAAHKLFDELAFSLEYDDGAVKQRDMIQPMIEQGATWESPARLAKAQIEIEAWLDGIPVPWTGWVDYLWTNNTALELKTTAALPSVPKASHVRQTALYRQATGWPMSILYLTGKKKRDGTENMACYPISEADSKLALEELRDGALRLQRFLAMVPDAETAINMLPPPADRWGYAARAKARLAPVHDASGFEAVETTAKATLP